MSKTISLALAIVILLTATLYQVYSSYQINDHHFIYPLDDTYIHMSCAKNMAQHGVWGVTPYQFSSSSSSLLYTSLLAFLYWCFGSSEVMPLIINLVSAVVLLFVFWRICVIEMVSPKLFFVVSVAMIFFIPLPALIISGMEHTLQLLIDFLFLYQVIKVVINKDPSGRYTFLKLSVLAFLTVTIRFEGMFLVALLAGLLFVRRQFAKSFAVIIFAVLPIIVYGIISIRNGAYFFPNSVMIKGTQPHFNAIGLYLLFTRWMVSLFDNPHLLVLFLSLAAYFLFTRIRRTPFWEEGPVSSFILLLLFMVHLSFAKTGWFFRYEAYLIFLVLAGSIWFIKDFALKPPKLRHGLVYLAFAFLSLPLLFPLVRRWKIAFEVAVPATSDVYNQQYQMARFLNRYYNTSVIAANDVGAITYFTKIRLFDMAGLASNEPVALKRASKYNKEALTKLTLEKNIQIVMIFDKWFKDMIPDQWQKAGEWGINNITLEDGQKVFGKVSIYATQLHSIDTLKRNLKNFSNELSKRITQMGPYMDSTSDKSESDTLR